MTYFLSKVEENLKCFWIAPVSAPRNTRLHNHKAPGVRKHGFQKLVISVRRDVAAKSKALARGKLLKRSHQIKENIHMVMFFKVS